MKISQGYNENEVDYNSRPLASQRNGIPTNIIHRLSMATGFFSEVTNESFSENNGGHSERSFGDYTFSDDEENQNSKGFSSSRKYSGDGDLIDESKRVRRQSLARQLSRISSTTSIGDGPPPVLTKSEHRWEQFQPDDNDDKKLERKVPSWKESAATIESTTKHFEQRHTNLEHKNANVSPYKSLGSSDNMEDKLKRRSDSLTTNGSTTADKSQKRSITSNDNDRRGEIPPNDIETHSYSDESGNKSPDKHEHSNDYEKGHNNDTSSNRKKNVINNESKMSNEINQVKNEESESDDDFIGFKPFSPPPAPGRRQIIPRNAILDSMSHISDISMNTSVGGKKRKNNMKKIKTGQRIEVHDEGSNEESQNESTDSSSDDDNMGVNDDKDDLSFNMGRTLHVLSKCREILKIVEGDNENSTASGSAHNRNYSPKDKARNDNIQEERKQLRNINYIVDDEDDYDISDPAKPNHDLGSIIQTSSALLAKKNILMDGSVASSTDLRGRKSSQASCNSKSEVNEQSSQVGSKKKKDSKTKNKVTSASIDSNDDTISEKMSMTNQSYDDDKINGGKDISMWLERNDERLHSRSNSNSNMDELSSGGRAVSVCSNMSPSDCIGHEMISTSKDPKSGCEEHESSNNFTLHSNKVEKRSASQMSRTRSTFTPSTGKESNEESDDYSPEKSVHEEEGLNKEIENSSSPSDNRRLINKPNKTDEDTIEVTSLNEVNDDDDDDDSEILNYDKIADSMSKMHNEPSFSLPSIDIIRKGKTEKAEVTNPSFEYDQKQKVVTTTPLNDSNHSQRKATEGVATRRPLLGEFLFPASDKSLLSSESGVVGLRLSSETSDEDSYKGNVLQQLSSRSLTKRSSEINKLVPIQSNIELKELCIDAEYPNEHREISYDEKSEIIVEDASENSMSDVIVEDASENSKSEIVVEDASENSKSDFVVEDASEAHKSEVIVEDASEAQRSEVVVEDVSETRRSEVVVETASESSDILDQKTDSKSDSSAVPVVGKQSGVGESSVNRRDNKYSRNDNEGDIEDHEKDTALDSRVDEQQVSNMNSTKNPNTSAFHLDTEKNIGNIESDLKEERSKGINRITAISDASDDNEDNRSLETRGTRGKEIDLRFDDISLGTKSEDDDSDKTDENISTIRKSLPSSIGDFGSGDYTRNREYQPLNSLTTEEQPGYNLDNEEEAHLQTNRKNHVKALNKISSQRMIGDSNYVLLNQEDGNNTHSSEVLLSSDVKVVEMKRCRPSSYFVFLIIVFSVVLTATLTIGLMSTRETSAPLIRIPTFDESAPSGSPTSRSSIPPTSVSFSTSQLSPKIPQNFNDITMNTNEWVEVASVEKFVEEGEVSSIAMTALEDGGFRMAVGSHNYSKNSASSRTGIVRVYDLMETDDGMDIYWKEVTSIEGGRKDDEFGYSLSLSGDGSLLAVGAPGYDVIEGSDSNEGRVSVYNLNSIQATMRSHTTDEASDNSNQTDSSVVNHHAWHIDGEFAAEQLGYSCALNRKGLHLAVGAPYHNKTTGVVRVFKNVQDTQWKQFGGGLYGLNEDDFFGASVSLSENGEQLLVGAPRKEDKDAQGGYVKIFNLVLTKWSQDGVIRALQRERDEFGKSVSQASDGSTIIIGSPASLEHRGAVIQYARRDDVWYESGIITGSSSEDHVGSSVDICDEAFVLSFSKNVQVINHNENIWSRSEVLSTIDNTKQVVSISGISGEQRKITSISSKNTVRTFLRA